MQYWNPETNEPAPTHEEYLYQQQYRANEILEWCLSLILQDNNVASLAYEYHFIYLKSRKFPREIASWYTQAMNKYLSQHCDYLSVACEYDSLSNFLNLKDVIGLDEVFWDAMARKVYEYKGKRE